MSTPAQLQFAYCMRVNRDGASTKLQWSVIYAASEREALKKTPYGAYGGPLLKRS